MVLSIRHAIPLLVVLMLGATSPIHAATVASCTDGSGKALPAEKCMTRPKGAATGSPPSPEPSGFAGRKALVLKNMRHAERVIKDTIACAEKAKTDRALKACAE